MKDLLLYMAKSLVDDPDSVTVTEVEGETTVLELRVAPEDMGKLIGRQGGIAKEDPHDHQVRCPAHRSEGQRRDRRLNECNQNRAVPLRTAGFCACPGAGCACSMQRTRETRAAIGRVPVPPGGSRIICEKPQQICIRLLIWLQGRCVTHPASAYRRTAYSFRSYFAEAPVSRLRQGR